MIAKVLSQSTTVRLSDGTEQRKPNLELIALHIIKIALSPEPRQAGMAIRLLREANPILEDPAPRSIRVEFVRPKDPAPENIQPSDDHPCDKNKKRW
jgi:hypothetical protein